MSDAERGSAFTRWKVGGACLLLTAALSLGLSACDEQSEVPTEPDGVVASFGQPPTGDPVGDVTDVFPSTNEDNVSKGWAHVLLVEVGRDWVTLEFVSERAFLSCFEYRADDESPTYPGPNPNTDITDGFWNYTCQYDSSEEMTLTAEQYVDVRMGFGGETDERFDWTRFYAKDACKKGGWQDLGFRNQGQCVRWIETGKDSRPSE